RASSLPRRAPRPLVGVAPDVAVLALVSRRARRALLALRAYVALQAVEPCRARIALVTLVALVTLGARIALQPLEPCRACGTFRTHWTDASAQGEVEGDAVVVRRTPAGRDHQAVGARRAEVRTVDRDVDLEGAPVSGGGSECLLEGAEAYGDDRNSAGVVEVLPVNHQCSRDVTEGWLGSLFVGGAVSVQSGITDSYLNYRTCVQSLSPANGRRERRQQNAEDSGNEVAP